MENECRVHDHKLNLITAVETAIFGQKRQLFNHKFVKTMSNTLLFLVSQLSWSLVKEIANLHSVIISSNKSVFSLDSFSCFSSSV